MDGITDSMDTSLRKLWEIVKDRGALCVVVHRVAMSWRIASGTQTIRASALASPSNKYSELISFKIDWFDLSGQGTLKSILQHHNSKASIL